MRVCVHVCYVYVCVYMCAMLLAGRSDNNEQARHGGTRL